MSKVGELYFTRATSEDTKSMYLLLYDSEGDGVIIICIAAAVLGSILNAV